MANEAVTTLVGNVGNCELRYTPNGVAVCKFSVAVTPRVKKGDEWVDGDPTWYNCTAWRELGEHVAESIEKGHRVIVLGRLSLRQYETDKGKGSSLDLEVDAVGPELRFAVAKPAKATKGGGSAPAKSSAADDPWSGATPAAPGASTGPSADSQRAAQEPATPW
jgi:single-strand DNA-binding protein